MIREPEYLIPTMRPVAICATMEFSISTQKGYWPIVSSGWHELAVQGQDYSNSQMYSIGYFKILSVRLLLRQRNGTPRSERVCASTANRNGPPNGAASRHAPSAVTADDLWRTPCVCRRRRNRNR